MSKFDEFYQLIERLHGLNGIQFIVCYTDKDGDLLPINNDNNLARVLSVTPGLLRLIIQRKGECYPLSSYHDHSNTMSYNNTTQNGQNSSYRASNIINQIKNLKDLSTTLNHNSKSPFFISYPEDFRPVSAIIDVDILPDTYRRVRLHKHKSSKPLGFYIRDGRSLRVTPQGVEQVPGIFISRLMPGGLAESTGLLSVNDEVIEVNGIEVNGKTLDQVTDMMVANSSNLIITVKPTNQRYNLNRSANMSQHNNTSLSLSKQITSSSSFNNKNKYSNGTALRSSIKNSKSKPIQTISKPNESITSSHSSSSFSSSNKQNQSIKTNNMKHESDSDDDDEEILDQHHDHSSNNKHDLIASTASIGVIINTNNNNNTKSSNDHSPADLNNSSSDHDNSDDKILTL